MFCIQLGESLQKYEVGIPEFIPVYSYPSLSILHYTTLQLHYTTLHYTTLHYNYTTLHYTTLHFTTTTLPQHLKLNEFAK